MNTKTLAETIVIMINESGDIIVVETILYYVRHGESVFVEGAERIRGLSDQGIKDAQIIRDILRYENIDMFFSSPYERSIETIRPTAIEQQKEIMIKEDLRERTIGDFSPVLFQEAKDRVFKDMQFAYPNGETSWEAQERAIIAIKNIIEANKGKKIVIGTHGDIMTLMLNYFDKRYGYDFWKSTSLPDIYKISIEGMELLEVKRMWE